MKKIIACLLVILSLISMGALSESAHEYVESLGLSFTSTEPDNGESPHCMLLENDSFQSIGFNEDGILYTLMALPAYQSSFDPMAFYSLFRDLNAKYDWDVSLYWPGYPDGKIAVSYGIERDLDQTERNFTDRGEYLAALSARLGLEAEPAGQTTSPPADVDLAGMSFDELIALRQQVESALWASDGWQDATVPGGVYIVGEDIPSGKWSVELSDPDAGSVVCAVAVFGSPEDYYDSRGCLSNTYLQSGAPYTLNLIDGQLVLITAVNTSVLFHPFTGASLGFK